MACQVEFGLIQLRYPEPFWREPEPVFFCKNGRISALPEPDIRYIPVIDSWPE